MSTQLRFEDVTAPVPDLEALARTTEGLQASVERATSVADCVEALKSWDEVRRGVRTYGSLVDLRFNQDTADPERKAAREAWDAARPRWTELEVGMKRTLLDHSLRAELEDALGAQVFALWGSQVLAFDSEIKDDLTRESALQAEYNQLLAGAEIDFRSEQHNLSTITKFRQEADRDLRHDTDRALWGWFAGNAVELDRIYDDLVHLRTRMAHKLGYDDFVDLGYKRMCRVDYGRADVERFRKEVVRDVVPLATELHRRQAQDLGVERLMAWDESVFDTRGNPLPKGDGTWLVARAREMFAAMGGGLDEFFGAMDDGGFLDLQSRKGKAGGGFCTSFATYGMPFVFANFNGTMGDVRVLTHEIGHAFQNFKSREQWPSDYIWPTLESCEVHSMGLEFLTWPHMDTFFGDDGDRFRRVHLIESLLFLPYGTAVDHFQHLVYETPDATPAERNAMWLEMERTYLPWRDWGDLAHPARGGRWQLQRHIYLSPFYYIDYVLAQTCALQFWARADEDREGTMRDYVELCTRGGSAAFQALVRSAGLVSPFEEGCLSRVVAHARDTL
ncbi:MAG: M3 family oligoendopeptidase [bacterium]|nr:M3 family oligoendopeptidase [bacterium]